MNTLREGLGRERWEALMERVVPAFGAAFIAARVPKLQSALRHLEAALSDLKVVRDQLRLPALVGEGDDRRHNPVAFAEISARSLCEQAAEYLRAEIAIFLRPAQEKGVLVPTKNINLKTLLPEDFPPSMSVGAPAAHTLLDDVLAPAVADLDWVTGLDLVYLSVVFEIERPFAEAPAHEEEHARQIRADGEKEEIELRRKKWQNRLGAARRH